MVTVEVMEVPSLRKTARIQLEWIWSLPAKVLPEPLLQAVALAAAVMAEQVGLEVHLTVRRAELVAVLQEMAGTQMVDAAVVVDTEAMEEAWLPLPMSVKVAADMGLLDCMQTEETDINPQ